MKKFSIYLLLIISCISFLPIRVHADNETLLDYKNLLKKYQDQYASTQSSINKTETEIKEANQEIADIKQEMIDMAAEISVLKDDITSYKEEIKEKELETKKLVEYLQLSSGANLYLEYAFDADSMTDLIYRMSVVEQLTDYNKDVINDLNDLITKSEEREKEINEKEKELTVKQGNLEKLIVSLGEDKNSLSVEGVSYSQQIKMYKEEIEMYEDLGCKDNDIIGVDCAVTSSIGTWRRPTTSGYITSEYGMRGGSLHRGLDIGNKKPYQTKIYAVANGTISKIYSDSYGALCLVVEHYDSKQKKYWSSSYCHLSKYNPKIYKGMTVTTNTWLGYMGATGYVTGPHLHIEIFDCRKYNAADKNCGSWNNFVNYAKKKYNAGYGGPRSLINFPKGTYNSWSSR